jgi:hypothetical protein
VQFCAGLPGPVRVAHEAGPTGFGLARALEPIGTESPDGGLAWLRYRASVAASLGHRGVRRSSRTLRRAPMP